MLARSPLWVDSNLSILELDALEMQAIHGMFIEAGSTDRDRAHKAILNNLLFTNTIRIGRLKPQEIMQLASYRQSEHEVDQIYGLMAASGVVITPIEGESLNEAWRRWWEAAIAAGHSFFALLPTLKDHSAPDSGPYSNCIMPALIVRTECIGRARLSDIPLMGRVTLVRSTLKAWGRRDGTVKIDHCLGKEDKLPMTMQELLMFYRRDTVITERFLLATSAAHETSRNFVTRMMRRLRDLVLFSGHMDNQAGLASDAIDEIYASWAIETQYQFSREFPADLYLATINTGKQKIDILIPSADRIPQGKLFAIDFNALDRKSTQTPHESRKRPMIVHVSENKLSSGQALHKISMAHPVVYWRSEELYESWSHEDVAILSRATQIQQFSIGGEACLYCRSCRKGLNRTRDIPSIWDTPLQDTPSGRRFDTGTIGDGKRKRPEPLPSRYSKRVRKIGI